MKQNDRADHFSALKEDSKVKEAKSPGSCDQQLTPASKSLHVLISSASTRAAAGASCTGHCCEEYNQSHEQLRNRVKEPWIQQIIDPAWQQPRRSSQAASSATTHCYPRTSEVLPCDWTVQEAKRAYEEERNAHEKNGADLSSQRPPKLPSLLL